MGCKCLKGGIWGEVLKQKDDSDCFKEIWHTPRIETG